MNRLNLLRNTAKRCLGALLLSALATSCSMMEEELPPCPQGLDIHFKYDYNLERADMFTDHVGGVTVYLFDEEGRLVTTRSQSNSAAAAPLRSHTYAMHFDVPPGRYTYLVTGWQKDYMDCLTVPGAKFRLTEPAAGGAPQDLAIALDNVPREDGRFDVQNAGMPLDTLWHGMSDDVVEVVPDVVTRDTVSLVRDTKHINITLRDIERPDLTDIADYDMVITDHNARILWNNDVDETRELVYRPYRTWNTTDKTDAPAAAAADAPQGVGRIAHADFMTSRIIYHNAIADDAVLSVTNRNTGVEIIRVNLADLLSRLRTSADRYYSAQEFLDRGYDYRLTFYLRGDRWNYVSVEISTLSWSKRVQREEL